VRARLRLPRKKETKMMPGPQELILILIIVVIVFGAKRIPEIMQGLGKGIREFKKSVEGDESPPQASSQVEVDRDVPASTPPRGPEAK
jgi:sec-independent protein translocase protein TatA